MSKRTKRLRKRLKKTARSVISVGAKVSRVAIPLVSFAAGVLYGPAASAVVTAAAHYPHQWQETVRARKYGETGADARRTGRVHAQRTTTHALYAGAAGATGALLVGGVGAGATGLLGSQQLGIAGSGAGVVPGLSNPFVTAPAPTVFPGGLTASQVVPIAQQASTVPTVLPGGLTSTQLITASQGSFAADAAFALPATTANLPFVSSASKLLSMETLTTAGGLVKGGFELYEKYGAKIPTDKIPGGDLFDKIPFPGGDGGGGGEGGGYANQKDTAPSGTSDFATLALLLGGAYLVSKAA